MKTVSRSKILPVALQLIVLGAAVFLAVRVMVERGRPTPLEKSSWSQRDGFVAVSFGGLSRDGEESGKLLPRQGFLEHLTELKKAGFTAIGLDEVRDFYLNNAPLPDRAVFIMFEGGRKDSAIFGQEVLERTGMRATMFVQTSLNDRWDRTYLNRAQIATLGKSRFWDVGSSGHEVFLPPTARDGDDHPPYFLTDFIRDDEGGALETTAELEARIAGDIRYSADALRRLTGEKPDAFLFQPANTLGNSLDPAVEAANRAIIGKTFSLVFAREGAAFNSRATDPGELTRMRVRPDARPGDLVRDIMAWMPSGDDYAYDQDGAASRWQVEAGGADFSHDGVAFRTMGGTTALAWLRGSDVWRNVDLSLGLDQSADVEQSLYLRYLSRASFIRITVAGGVVRVQERVLDRGLSTLASMELPEARKTIALAVTLRNNRLALLVDGVPISPHPLPISRNVRTGRLAFEVRGLSGDRGGVGHAGVLRRPSFRPMADRWLVGRETAGPDPEELTDGGRTGLALRLEDKDASTAVPALLLRAAERGVATFARLPDGELDFGPLQRANAPLPESIRLSLWDGVLFSPSPLTRWEEIAVAAARAEAAGLQAGVAVTPGQAAELAAQPLGLPLAWVLIDGAELSDAARTALKKRYDNVLVLSGKEYGRL